MDKPTTAAEAVAQGAQLLDREYPGWHRLINLEKLDISSCQVCICGQLGTALLDSVVQDDPYTSFLCVLDDKAQEEDLDEEGDLNPELCGFSTLFDDEQYYNDRNEDISLPPETYEITTWAQLDAEWTQAIKSRLAHDELQTEEVTSTASNRLVHV